MTDLVLTITKSIYRVSGTCHCLKSKFAVYQRVMRPSQLPPASEVCQDTVDFILVLETN